MAITARKRIWGWFFFDWASQPYNTLLLTFVFGPYMAEMLGDGSRAQAVWGFGVAAAGIVIAAVAPILGAMADTSGNRMGWIRLFSVLYVVAAAGLWFAAPDGFNLILILGLFATGLVAMEFATIFTNAMLPDLVPREEIGRISGSGWAFGYLGGLCALVIMLLFLAENGATGRTLLGIEPILGLDPAKREGTRSVGPVTAIWFAVFMVPFFVYVREPKPARAAPGAVARALGDLARTLHTLPARRSLSAYLLSSMLYRDALNGLYTFGGIYAVGVLGWSLTEVGIFGILAIISGAAFAWAGGRADAAFGPKPVIVISILVLLFSATLVALITGDSLLGLPVGPEGAIPDTVRLAGLALSPVDATFYLIGAAIGAAGGTLQAASRTMMVHQADPARMTEAFGLYALAGKATSFLAPLSIGIVTAATGSQQWGVTPLIILFLGGLILLGWVQPEGDRAE